MQLSYQFVLCAVGAVCLLLETRSVGVCLFLLHGQAVFTESVPGHGPSWRWVTWSGILQRCILCSGSFLVDQIVFLLFSYNLVCLLRWWLCVGQSPRTSWLRGQLSGCNTLLVRALLWSVLLSLSFRWIDNFSLFWILVRIG